MTQPRPAVPPSQDYATESVIFPAILLSRESIQRIYQECRNRAINAARTGMPGVRLTVRGLLPSDLGETNEIWSDQLTTTANAYQNSIIASQNIANERYIGIYGLTYIGTQAVRALRWTVKATKIAVWDLTPILSDDVRLDARTGYTPAPFIVPQNIGVTVEQYPLGGVEAGIQAANIAYLGVVVEKAGRTIDV